jgi:hypothetical protein
MYRMSSSKKTPSPSRKSPSKKIQIKIADVSDLYNVKKYKFEFNSGVTIFDVKTKLIQDIQTKSGGILRHVKDIAIARSDKGNYVNLSNDTKLNHDEPLMCTIQMYEKAFGGSAKTVSRRRNKSRQSHTRRSI